MKFRRLISLLIIAVILIAFFTTPKETAFYKLIQSNSSRTIVAPLIEYKNHLIYSEVTLTYFTPVSEQGKTVAVASKSKYIGIFGRFWKQ
ncbi:MAG: hypothetical protein QM640_06805 [Niabella sp.]